MAQSFDPSAPQPGATEQGAAPWTDQARDMGRQALDGTAEATAATRDMIKDHPTATLAVIGGLAFAIGALWMVGRSRQAQPSLLDRLGNLQAELPRRWRS